MSSNLIEDPWDNLLGEKGGKGWPYVVFLDADGKVLLPHTRSNTVEDFRDLAHDAEAYLAARESAAAGDRSAAIDMVLLELEHRVLARAEGEAKLAGLGTPSDRQAQRRDLVLAAMRAREICEGAAKKVEADDFAAAIADFTSASELDPESAAAFAGNANARRRYGDLEGAVADYGRAIDIEPKGAWWYYARGNARYDSGARAEALADYVKACELDPGGQPYAHLGMWLVRAAAGEREAATEDLRTFLEGRVADSADEWYHCLARFLMGDLPVAGLLERAGKGSESTVKSQRCDAYFYAGTLRLIEGDAATAKDYFEKCVATGVKGYTEYASALAGLKALAAAK